MVKRRLELNEKSIEKVATLLKVVDKSNDEQILIDRLINLNNYDPLLDDEIEKLSKRKALDKKKRINKNNTVLMEMAFKKIELEYDNEITKEEYENGDYISKLDYYRYSHQVKDRKETEIEPFEAFGDIF